MARKKSDTKHDNIRKDLLDQLEEKGIYGSMYTDMVDDYLSLWEIKNALIGDIKSRGVSVQYNNGGGQTGFKKNDSISELNKTNAQMLKILSELGLKATPKVVDEDEAEEM